MTALEQVRKIVLAAIEEVNELQPDDAQIGTAGDVSLTGANAQIKSLTLVNLLVNIEDQLADSLGVSTSILDDEALSEEPSPLETIDSLTAYLTQRVDDDLNG